MTKKYRRAAWIAVFAKRETTAELQLKKFHLWSAPTCRRFCKPQHVAAIQGLEKKTFCIGDIHVMLWTQTFLPAIT